MENGGIASSRAGTDGDSSANKSTFSDQILTTRQRYVYFIQSGPGGAIKIGETYDPGERCKNFQIGNPAELSILLIVPADRGPKEARLHWMFRKYSIRGEWFHPAPAILEHIDKWRRLLMPNYAGPPLAEAPAEIERLGGGL